VIETLIYLCYVINSLHVIVHVLLNVQNQCNCIGHIVGNPNALATVWAIEQTLRNVDNRTNIAECGQCSKHCKMWAMK